jgi:hypothetical protein
MSTAIVQATNILKEEFDLIKADLIKAYDAKGMRASGNWANSLEVQVKGFSATLTGEKYSEQLEFGRKAGKQPPSEAIEQWIRDKGLSSRIEGNISISSLAYLIARKIAREGWKRESYGGVDLISQVVTPERIQAIIDRVTTEYIPVFEKEIKLMFA